VTILLGYMGVHNTVQNNYTYTVHLTKLACVCIQNCLQMDVQLFSQVLCICRRDTSSGSPNAHEKKVTFYFFLNSRLGSTC